MQAGNNGQVKENAGVYKPDATEQGGSVSRHEEHQEQNTMAIDLTVPEELINVFQDACKEFEAIITPEVEIDNPLAVHEEVLSLLRSMFEGGGGDDEEALKRALASIVFVKGLATHCAAFGSIVGRELVGQLNSLLTNLAKNQDKGLTKILTLISRITTDDIVKAKSMINSLIDIVRAHSTIRLTIDVIKKWREEGRLKVIYNEKDETFIAIVKAPNLKNEGKDVQFKMRFKLAELSKVYKQQTKYDCVWIETEEGKKQCIFEGPKILDKYLIYLLGLGWGPIFHSIEFVEIIFNDVINNDQIIDTPDDIDRQALVNFFLNKGYVKIEHNDGKRIAKLPKNIDWRDIIYLDEENGKLLVPRKLYSHLEHRSKWKSLFTKELIERGILIRDGQLPYTHMAIFINDKIIDGYFYVFGLDALNLFLRSIDVRELLKPIEARGPVVDLKELSEKLRKKIESIGDSYGA
jgi:hypothetical protein